MKRSNMKKVIGFILAFVLTIGLAFGIQQIVSSKSHSASPRTSKQAASSSSKSSSQKQPAKKASSDKAKKTPSNKKDAKKAGGKKAASGQSSKANSTKPGKQTTKTRKQAATTSPKKTATKRTATTPKSDKLGKVNHKNETKVVAGNSKAASKPGNTANTIKIYLRVDGYKKTFYAKSMRVKKNANAVSVLKQTKLKISYIPGHSVYINGINGLRENDVKTGSGWMFSVNHKFIDHAANLTPLKSGDRVHWYFTTKGY